MRSLASPCRDSTTYVRPSMKIQTRSRSATAYARRRIPNPGSRFPACVTTNRPSPSDSTTGPPQHIPRIDLRRVCRADGRGRRANAGKVPGNILCFARKRNVPAQPRAFGVEERGVDVAGDETWMLEEFDEKCDVRADAEDRIVPQRLHGTSPRHLA